MAQPTDRGGPAMDRDEIEAAVWAERLSLCDFLDGLDEPEWGVQSLCSAWTVREVVAHLTVTTRATIPFVLKAAIKARGDFHRMTADVARARATAFTPAELVRQLRESADSSRRMPGSGPMDPLLDLLVHGQDIARPLQRRHAMRTEVAVAALAYLATTKFHGGPQRIAGLEIVATDATWSLGAGPAIRGKVEDLLLVAAGRPSGLAHLTGPGVDRLAERLAAG
ncbi:maleylpyruvate isomerase family mycothiol-dependent enzyme [Pseudonocardia nigra]|uniref:maleylpyruvate isomerase family mycothiol-dependent enzyme n=1 Tax=Pseudonocardia nigra TaxID=1921578 RepID=UPI001FE3458C|nr:maleylpyruvate isomerase family mycothiol-dependent enzyme [Pseudonocardia nigra]